MDEFNTLEQVSALFANAGAQINNNNFFVAFKDMTKNSGMVGGMEYPYDAVIINFGESGLNFLYLKQDGIVFKQDLSKMHVDKNSYNFISTDEIEEIIIKKFALLNNTKKKITIKLKNKKTHYLYASLNEPLLPYHNSSFDNFIKKYSN